MWQFQTCAASAAAAATLFAVPAAAHVGADSGKLLLTGGVTNVEGAGFTFHQDIVGVKLRVLGDAVYDQDRWWPQVALGAEFKRNDRAAVVRAAGARRPPGSTTTWPPPRCC